MPSSTVGWLLPVPPFFWKKDWLDQSSRNSSRLSSQLLILYSPVRVASFTDCAVPVVKPSGSSYHSRRPATDRTAKLRRAFTSSSEMLIVLTSQRICWPSSHPSESGVCFIVRGMNTTLEQPIFVRYL